MLQIDSNRERESFPNPDPRREGGQRERNPNPRREREKEPVEAATQRGARVEREKEGFRA